LHVEQLVRFHAQTESIMENISSGPEQYSAIILSVCSLVDNFLVEAEEKLNSAEAGLIDNIWILDIFALCGLEQKFIEAFEAICRRNSTDTNVLYAVSNKFFYCQLRYGKTGLFSEEGYKAIMGRIISEKNTHKLLNMLRKNKLIE